MEASNDLGGTWAPAWAPGDRCHGSGLGIFAVHTGRTNEGVVSVVTRMHTERVSVFGHVLFNDIAISKLGRVPELRPPFEIKAALNLR